MQAFTIATITKVSILVSNVWAQQVTLAGNTEGWLWLRQVSSTQVVSSYQTLWRVQLTKSSQSNKCNYLSNNTGCAWQWPLIPCVKLIKLFRSRSDLSHTVYHHASKVTPLKIIHIISCATQIYYSMLYLSIYLISMSHIFRNDVVFAQTITGLVLCLVGWYWWQSDVLKDSQANWQAIFEF